TRRVSVRARTFPRENHLIGAHQSSQTGIVVSLFWVHHKEVTSISFIGVNQASRGVQRRLRLVPGPGRWAKAGARLGPERWLVFVPAGAHGYRLEKPVQCLER